MMPIGDLSDFSIIGPVLSGAAQRAVRGVMANLDAGLALAFQINPQEVQHDKEVNYEVDQPVGWNGPIVTWVSGGKRSIKFNLFFDGTQAAVDSGLSLPNVPMLKTSTTNSPSIQAASVPIPTRGRPGSPPFVGVRGVEAVLDSFLEPQAPLAGFLGSKVQNRPPPECYLLLGVRFWRTRLLRAPYREVLHDKLLTPLRLYADLEFLVLEEGAVQDANLIQRKALATAESTVGFMATFLSVF